MEKLHYTNYNIDAADIWEYECSCYGEGKGDKNGMKELYKYLQDFYLLANHKPFIEEGDESNYAEEYRERYNNRKEDEVTWTFFVCGRKVYAMSLSCEIFLKKDNHVDYQRLFILKLCQYLDGLIYLEHFLKHQLEINFKNNLDRFQKFMKVSLLQYQNAIDATIIKTVEEWFLEMGKKKSEKASKPKLKRSKRGNFVEQLKTDTRVTDPNLEGNTTRQTHDSNSSPEQNQANDVSCDKNENQKDVNPENNPIESVQENQAAEKSSDGIEKRNSAESLPNDLETEEIIPKGYKVVEGKFTKEEVLQFFSFLYKEKSKEGKTFLMENEVRDLFKYGLAIPPEPPAKKYKLNCSLKFPKSIVEYGIYTFYKEHTGDFGTLDHPFSVGFDHPLPDVITAYV